MPAPGPPIPGQGFGAARPGGRFHKGIDLRSAIRTCVVASDAGTILSITPESAGGPGGNEIVIRTAAGDMLVYSHTIARPGLKAGSAVAEGEGIGRTDHGSGTAAGRPHLHYQWKPKGAPDYDDPGPRLNGANPYPGEAACSPSMITRK